MAVKFQGGKAVPVPNKAMKAARDKQLGRLMNELSAAREKVFKASQELTKYGVPSALWNSHVGAMKEFYQGVDAVYNDAARMLHVQETVND